MGNQLEPPMHEEAVGLAKSISANSNEETFNHLAEFAVKWVLKNPMPIALNRVDYQR